MSMNARTTPPTLWETELRLLVLKEIKEQVTKNVHDPTYLSVWVRRPHNFVESEASKLLDECWQLLKVWRPAYEAAHDKFSLPENWSRLSVQEKGAVALNFKKFFYEKRGYFLIK